MLKTVFCPHLTAAISLGERKSLDARDQLGFRHAAWSRNGVRHVKILQSDWSLKSLDATCHLEKPCGFSILRVTKKAVILHLETIWRIRALSLARNSHTHVLTHTHAPTQHARSSHYSFLNFHCLSYLNLFFSDLIIRLYKDLVYIRDLIFLGVFVCWGGGGGGRGEGEG